MPVREHIQQFFPPPPFLIQVLGKHFYWLLKLYQKYNGEQLQLVVNQITLNLGNLQEVLQQELYDTAPNLVDTIYCTLSLNSFYRLTRRGHTVLINLIPPILSVLGDHELEIHFIIEVLKANSYLPALDPEQLHTKGLILFEYVDNPGLECEPHYFFKLFFVSYDCYDCKQNSMKPQRHIFSTLNWIHFKLCNIMKRCWNCQKCVVTAIYGVLF
jgi:hypothetical protein